MSKTKINEINLIPFEDKYGKWGYKDKTTKELIIECKYDYVDDFEEGKALVRFGNKYDFIDAKGNITVGDFKKKFKFFEGLAIVKSDYRYGFINTKGEVVIPMKYNDANDFKDGLALVKFDGRYGFIDAKGEEVIRINYGYALEFSEDLAAVRTEFDNKWFYINKNGEFVIGGRYGYDNALSFCNGFAAVAMWDTFGGKPWDGAYQWAYIDKEGNKICEFIYWAEDEPGQFCNGLASLQNGDQKYGYINTKGEEVIDFIYDCAYGFEDGKAEVELDGETFFIDTEGNRINANDNN